MSSKQKGSNGEGDRDRTATTGVCVRRSSNECISTMVIRRSSNTVRCETVEVDEREAVGEGADGLKGLPIRDFLS